MDPPNGTPKYMVFEGEEGVPFSVHHEGPEGVKVEGNQGGIWYPRDDPP